MRRRKLRSTLFLSMRLLCFLGGLTAASRDSDAELLHIQLPEHWELREPERQGSVLRLQAREQVQGATLQLLELTAVNTASAPKAIDPNSIRGLAAQLRDAALRSAVETKIDLVPLGTLQGYYFVVTDRRQQRASSADYRQMVEGVGLYSGYLINFTLLTDDAGSVDTRQMISALAQLRIE